MSKPIPVDDTNFDESVLQAKMPILVDFTAVWCGPCRMVEPIVEELGDEYAGRFGFVRVDVDKSPKTAVKYGIMSIPSLLVFKDGKVLSNMVGFKPKAEVKKMLDAALA